MFDTHCHLTYPGLLERVDDVLSAARARGVDRFVSVSTTPSDARRALQLSRAHPGVLATVGIHPHHAGTPFDERVFRELAGEQRVVALGEMGLDRHYDEPDERRQRIAFERQLIFAAEPAFIDLPVIIHNREATQTTLEMLRDSGIDARRFVFHCFSGSAHELDAILEFGAMVSLTGIVTFKNAASLAEATDRVPLDRLMVETDAPYLTPEPYRKVKPNEPQYVLDVARFLAERRGLDQAEFIAHVDRNARRFFGVD